VFDSEGAVEYWDWRRGCGLGGSQRRKGCCKVNGGTNAITVLYEYGEWIFKVFEMSELIEVGDNNYHQDTGDTN